MSTRQDRYGAAMVLAHEILDGPPDEDGRRLAEAVADLTGELVAGRKNQQEFPDVRVWRNARRPSRRDAS